VNFKRFRSPTLGFLFIPFGGVLYDFKDLSFIAEFILLAWLEGAGDA